MTLQGGLRYEHAWSWFPGGENGILADNQFGSQYVFPETKGVTGYHDINPRMGAAFDLFGTGKTSLKVNVGKYLQAANNDAQFTMATTPSRSSRRLSGRGRTPIATTWPIATFVARRPTASAACGRTPISATRW